MGSNLEPLRFAVSQVTVDQGLYLLTLNLQESDKLDDSLEGYAAWWPSSPKNGSAEVLSIVPEFDQIHLRYATASPPPPGSSIQLYPPNFLESLAALWNTSHGAQFLDWSEAVREQKAACFAPLDARRFDWLRRAQIESFALPAWRTSFLWGPPGTGKTTTLAAMLATLLLDRPYSRVLLIASNNVAVDQAILAVDEVLARLGQEALRPLIKRVGTRFNPLLYLGREHLLERPDPGIVTSLRELESRRPPQTDPARYRRWKEQRDLVEAELRIPLARTLATARLMAMTAHRAVASFQTLLETGLFQLVCVDEASQIPLPFALAVPALGGATLFAGDPKQLPPIHRAPDPEVSPWFAHSPFSLLGETNDPPYTVFLDEQSRMARPICDVVSKTFYAGRLRTAELAAQDATWSAHRKPLLLFPRKRCANSFLLRCEGASTYWPSYGGHVRVSTAKKVLEVVQRLAAQQSSESILVLTPFRGQRNYLRALLRESQLEGVHVSTVHRAQGSEVQMVLFDPVQTATRFLGENLDLARRLMNVALSRAQSCLFLFATNNDLQHPIVQELAAHFEVHFDLREHPDLDRLTLEDLHAKNFPANVRNRDLLIPLGNQEWVPGRILDATASIRFLRLEDWREETISVKGMAARIASSTEPYPEQLPRVSLN